MAIEKLQPRHDFAACRIEIVSLSVWRCLAILVMIYKCHMWLCVLHQVTKAIEETVYEGADAF